MAKKQYSKPVIKHISLNAHKTPQFAEERGKDWVKYGVGGQWDNAYPDYLLYLFENSAKHNAIVTGKVNYIAGKGWTFNDKDIDPQLASNATAFIDKANRHESLYEVNLKLALDLELFDGFALEVIWDEVGSKPAEIYHIPFNKIRRSADGKRIFYSDNWKDSKQSLEKTGFRELSCFDLTNKKGTQVFYYRKYRPKASGQTDVYPYPDYMGAIKYIEIDAGIGNFHYNNLKNGFVGGTIVAFNNGQPTDEEADQIERRIKQKFTGTDNAGEIILVFNDGKDKEPTIIPMQGNNFDEKFQSLNDMAQQEIFTGHKVVSPMLFGIKTEGQLGGRNELIEASELFKNTYVTPRQQILEQAIEFFAKLKGINVKLNIIPVEPIGFQFSEDTLSKYLRPDEMRALIAEKNGIELKDDSEFKKPSHGKIKTNIPEIISSIADLNRAVKDGVMTGESAAGLLTELCEFEPEFAKRSVGLKANKEKDAQLIECFKKYGTPRSEVEIHLTRKVWFGSDTECLESELEAREKNFEGFEKTVTPLDRAILDLLKKDPLMPDAQIAKVLKLSPSEVSDRIGKLIKNDLIKEEKVSPKTNTDGTRRVVTKDGIDIIKDEPPKTIDIIVMYSYEVLSGEGPPIIPTTRDFCRELIQLDRLYTRKEIQAISAEVGYDVWAYRGGWWREKGTNRTHPYCRHTWISNIITKRKK